MAKISIKNMEFFSHHGCFSEEQKTGTHFVVNLMMEANVESAEYSDNLEETINYVDVYQLIKTEMNKNSKLLEHVARRSLDAVMKTFPLVTYAEFEIEKMNPPLGGKIGSVAVFITSSQTKS